MSGLNGRVARLEARSRPPEKVYVFLHTFGEPEPTEEEKATAVAAFEREHPDQRIGIIRLDGAHGDPGGDG